MATAGNAFDRLMNSTCTVMAKGVGPSEGYGQPSQTLTPVTGMSNLPCRISTTKSGKEYRSGKEYSINTFLVFMRVPASGQVTTRHWLVVTEPSGTQHTLNLIAVNNPSGLNHHLECWGEEVTP